MTEQSLVSTVGKEVFGINACRTCYYIVSMRWSEDKRGKPKALEQVGIQNLMFIHRAVEEFLTLAWWISVLW